MASGGHCKENFFSALHKIIGVAGAQRPDSHVSELKRTGARSARARTRGQNPLVCYNYDIFESANHRFKC